jgi:serine/threonine-protein kinase
MPTPTTAEQFLDLVRKSNLVDEPALTTFLRTGTFSSAQGLAGGLVRAGLVTAYQGKQLLAGKHRGFFLGVYKVLQPLGRGAMASVYLAEHTAMRRRVAIKIFPTEFADDEAALRRFQREARAVAALDHPNIVRAYDVGQQGHLHYLVLEFVEGETLEELSRRRGRMPIGEAITYVLQALEALQHANERGIVHRDIKPSNLLVTREGQLKVLDMGLARFFRDSADDLTRNLGGAVLGTADFIAPEQALTSEVDTRADIYSLGATFYTLLCGAPPFSGKTTSQKLIAHQLKVAEPVHLVCPEIPFELSRIIGRMMAKQVEDRYQTPAEALTDLHAFTAARRAAKANRAQPTQHMLELPFDEVEKKVKQRSAVRRDGRKPRRAGGSSRKLPRSRARRRRWLLFAVAAVLLTIMGAGGGWALHAGGLAFGSLPTPPQKNSEHPSLDGSTSHLPISPP